MITVITVVLTVALRAFNQRGKRVEVLRQPNLFSKRDLSLLLRLTRDYTYGAQQH